MVSFLPFTRLLRSAPAALPATPSFTGLTGPSISLPPSHFARLLLLAFGAWLGTACTSESSPDQATTDTSSPAEGAPEDSANTDDGNDECRKIQHMWDALPKLKTYKQFKLDETDCLAVKHVISYKFGVAGDNKALMTVALWDEDKDENENAFIKYANEVNQATTNPNGGARKSTLGIGEIPTVSGGMLSDTQSGGKFICLLKGHYYFEIMVALSDKSLTKPEAVESFVQEYVKQIDLSKLK